MSLTKKLCFVLLGLLLTTFGLKFLSLQSLTFGGTAGIASLLSNMSHFSWGFWFFIANLPFFFISLQQLGKWFTISSLLSITFITLIRSWIDTWLLSFNLNMIAVSILAGLLIGIGVTLVLNNGSSLGGIHILALYLDKKFGFNRGLIIFICDSLIILFALTMVGWQKALVSILCISIASSIIGRYKKAPIQESVSDEDPSLLESKV
ncbi:YitT family protein [Bacillus sp. Marseille-P3661]|uniref:YitT family protein n=1 Tax=Bacillus sp. Marseille-P3661 TaxID=1936234 RepID=UPI000C82EB43|nr:YitT family protein [Bacillus sp. Marseille-P3661]